MADLSEIENELVQLIEQLLKNPCQTNLPRLCEFVKTQAGKETATTMIKEYCIEHGVSAQEAMAQIDSEL